MGKMPLIILSKCMKDRIRQIMESKGMTQQVFAQFIDQSPSSLSNIFNDRTKPTLNVVEAIKKKIPDINIDWLLFGTGQMYTTSSAVDSPASPTGVDIQNDNVEKIDPMLSFDFAPSPTAEVSNSQVLNFNSVKSTRQNPIREEVKIIDKPKRRVTEIRVFYDDQTWESFIPSMK